MTDAYDLVVRNGTLVSVVGRHEVDIGIAGDQFAAIAERGELTTAQAAQSIDAEGLFVLPGIIDSHVHFRQPGLEHKEDWLTGTRAAVMGGVTTVLDMPNTVPPTDTADRAQAKLALAGSSAYCDFGLLGLAGSDVSAATELIESGLVCGLKSFLGPTTGGLSVPPEASLRDILSLAAKAGMRVAFHAEDGPTIERLTDPVRTKQTDMRVHLDARPVSAEARAVDHVGRLLVGTGAPGHVLHLSSVDGLNAIEGWLAVGVDLTAEVTPHHCFLDVEIYERAGGLAIVNPPIRGEPHSSRLLGALAGGRIQAIGSDHAPHTFGEKQAASVWDVAPGISGVETMLRLFLTYGVNAGRMTLERLAYTTSEGPAKVWGLWPQKGRVAVGSDADLTIVDLGMPGVIRAAELHGKNNQTPFEGWPTKGAAVATIVRGRIVMRGGELLGEPGWGRRVVA